MPTIKDDLDIIGKSTVAEPELPESYVNYKPHRGRINETFYNAVEDGIKLFTENETNIYRNLPNNESRNFSCDIEASYLSHGIWTQIMQNKRCPGTSNEFLWEQGTTKQLFHFDIMNNPKPESCGLAAACLEEKRNEWENIYHSIGNMTPIPWFEVDINHSINGQLLHRALDERWDLYLNFLKDNWKVYGGSSGITFEDYMILTCQQMYYKDIFSSIKEKELKDINIEDINDWNTKIKEDSQLISLALGTPEDVDTMVGNIIRLIKIRCRVIYLLLTNQA